MRGKDVHQNHLFSYVSPEERVPYDHPLRRIKAMADQALKGPSREFSQLYSDLGRPSIAPEKLLRALLLQALYSIRSERQLMEQLDYNLLYRWFVGLSVDEPVWNPSTFSKNRDRLLERAIAQQLLAQVVAQADAAELLSHEHFTVDGTLIEAWASLKSFRRKGSSDPPPDDPGNPTVNFHGEKRSNETHESTTDPDARLARKGDGQAAQLSYCGSVLMDNRHGLPVDVDPRMASGTAERDAAEDLMKGRGGRGVTLGADKAYDTRAFVAAMRAQGVTPHVAQNTKRNGGSAIDGRTTRHAGYAISQRKRKLVEECFGWMKTVRTVCPNEASGRGTRRLVLRLSHSGESAGSPAAVDRSAGSVCLRIGRSVSGGLKMGLQSRFGPVETASE
jgi:transposase